MGLPVKEQREEPDAQGYADRDEQTAGDAIYWPLFNLDLKNPNSADALEHRSPRELIAGILDKEHEREVLAPGGRGNVFQLHEDNPADYDELPLW